MPSALTVIEVAITVFLTVQFVRNIATTHARRGWLAFLRFGPWGMLKIFLISIPIIAIVLTVGITLITVSPKILGFTWLQIFSSPDHKEAGTNLMVAGATKIPAFGVLFLVLFMANIPRLARIEEEQFRRGTKDWKDGAWRSLRFGLAHCIVGVPVGIGLALGLGGLWFTYQYFKGGVGRSTVYHSIYNWILAVFLFVFLVLSFDHPTR